MTANFIISDFVSRINVAVARRLLTVVVLRNSLSVQVVYLLYINGVISSFRFSNNRRIIIFLKYFKSFSAFRGIKIVSTPGHRVFWTLNYLALKYFFGNFSGFYIISTSKGLLTSNDCLLSTHVSGEVILKVSI
jgi:ribosomal protein S8